MNCEKEIILACESFREKIGEVYQNASTELKNKIEVKLPSKTPEMVMATAKKIAIEQQGNAKIIAMESWCQYLGLDYEDKKELRYMLGM